MRSIFTLMVFALLLEPTSGFAQRDRDRHAEPADKKEKVEIPATGSELFRAFLDSKGVKPVAKEDVERGRIGFGEDLIVIVMGNAREHRRLAQNPFDLVQTAIQHGGAGFIAADTELRYADNVVISGGRVISPPAHCLDNDEDYPYVVPVTEGRLRALPESPSGQLFHNLTRVATNSPAYLTCNNFSGETRFALAKFPVGSGYVDRWRDKWKLPDDALFAVGGHGPDLDNGSPYRFLMMADHSVFINEMLIEPGTQNLELTYRVIEFLQGPQKRKRCLFIENGRVIDKFDGLRQAFAKPKPQMPMPNLPQEKLVDFGNKIVDDLQSRNVFNRALDRMFGLPVMMRFFVLLLSLYGIWFLMKRFFSSRKPTDIPPAPSVAGVASGPPGVFDRRQKELVRRNNVYEPVRDMVRDYFASLGIHGTPGPKLPELVVTRAVKKPESLRLAIKDFWKLAYGPPQEMSVNRWRELEGYFVRLQQAHAAGKWYFVLKPAMA